MDGGAAGFGDGRQEDQAELPVGEEVLQEREQAGKETNTVPRYVSTCERHACQAEQLTRRKAIDPERKAACTT